MTLESHDSMKKWVKEHAGDDCSDLLLKYKGKKLEFSLEFAVCQITCRRKTMSKLTSFLKHEDFLFPDYLSAEQASDERVAKYHTYLIGNDKKILDMTSGLGIDAMTASMAGNYVIACDIDRDKTEALIHNASVLNIPSEPSNHLEYPVKTSLQAVCENSERFLFNSSEKYDVIFIDPARRGENNARLYSFKDCVPDVLSLMPMMLMRSKMILIKASPLLDITQILREIPCTTNLHLICVRNECKEVLVEIIKDIEFQGIHVLDLNDKGIESHIYFDANDIHLSGCPYATESDLTEGNYLYEPNAALMKLKSPGAICSRFDGLKKLSSNTSLYVSGKLHKNFPGRISRITDIPARKQLKKLRNKPYNVVCRNYPSEVKDLRRKLGVKEGAKDFIYAFRAYDIAVPTIVCTHKIN